MSELTQLKKTQARPGLVSSLIVLLVNNIELERIVGEIHMIIQQPSSVATP